MIKKIYDKCVSWAGHKYAKPFLAFESFIESSFFPIPPDVMIVPMVVAKRKEFINIALIATIFSVLGALFGYLIGYVFFNEIGIKIFELYGYEDPNFLKDKFSSKGGFFSWLGILITAGFTPLPYKAFTIASGLIAFNLPVFIIVSLISRSLRFFIVAFLSYKYGELFTEYMNNHGSKWFTVIGILLVIVFVFAYLVLKFNG